MRKCTGVTKYTSITARTGNMYTRTALRGGRCAVFGIVYDDYSEDSMQGYYSDNYHNGCRLSTDYMTKEQILALNGECIIIQSGKVK